MIEKYEPYNQDQLKTINDSSIAGVIKQRLSEFSAKLCPRCSQPLFVHHKIVIETKHDDNGLLVLFKATCPVIPVPFLGIFDE